MGTRVPKKGEPSLIEPRSTGGIHAGAGFRVQERYIALRVAQWLAQPEFEGFQSERSEDVDARFAGGVREYHQVKDEQLTPGSVKAIIDEFVERNSNLIKESRNLLRNAVLGNLEVARRESGNDVALGVRDDYVDE